MSLLHVNDLSVSLAGKEKRFDVLHDISFDLEKGECLSIVGESGCGKTICALSLMGLLPTSGKIDKGRIVFNGKDIAGADEKTMSAIRGKRIAMIFQDAQSALNPYLRISEQLIEGIMRHDGLREKKAISMAVDMLKKVGISGAEERVHDYPHQFSGGMLQRIMIAMALMTSPDLIIADEPTSALDVTIQAQTLKLFDDLMANIGSAVILITHDLGVAAGRSRTLAVFYAGAIVEIGLTARVLEKPLHPYMEALLRSNPSIEDSKEDRLIEIAGQPPPIGRAAQGCAFAPRCEKVMDRCRKETPVLMSYEDQHKAACFACCKDR